MGQDLLLKLSWKNMATRISPNTGDLPAQLYILTNSILFTLLRYISKPSPLVSRQSLIAEFASMVDRSL